MTNAQIEEQLTRLTMLLEKLLAGGGSQVHVHVHAAAPVEAPKRKRSVSQPNDVSKDVNEYQKIDHPRPYVS